MTVGAAQQREPAVAVGSSQRPWVAELMSYAQDHAGVRVVGTLLSSREAVEHEYDVLLIDDTTSYLTKRLVDRVQLMNRVVVGVYESAHNDVGRQKLLDLGVDAVMNAESSPREFLIQIKALTEQLLVDKDFAEIVAEDQELIPEGTFGVAGEKPVDDGSYPGGSVVTMVSGSNGVAEVAVTLASEIARRGVSVVLVDLDTVEPAIAQRLGAPLVPNVLSAIDSVRFSGEIGEAVSKHGSGLAVLAGLPSPREWEACGADDAADLLDLLAAAYAHVIVRVDRNLEDLAPFGVAPGRFDLARRLVTVADHLVVVGDPSPTGVTAVLAWIGEVRSLSGKPVHVVMNHCGRSMYQRGEIVEEIGRTFRSASVTFAPEDPKVRKAGWQGDVAAPCRFSRSLQPLVSRVAAPATSRGGSK